MESNDSIEIKQLNAAGAIRDEKRKVIRVVISIIRCRSFRHGLSLAFRLLFDTSLGAE